MRRLLAFIALLALLPAGFAADKVSDRQATTASQTTEQDAPPERISVDFSNEEIRTILRNVADMYELNLVVPDTLQGRCGAFKFRDVTWRQIFREAIAPVGYTFIEDENIVRVVSIEAMKTLQAARNKDQQCHAAASPCASPRWLCLFAAPFAIIHLILAIGVLRDRLPGAARYAPKSVWAGAVLLGGLVPLLAYWIIHHSSLAKSEGGGPPPKLE